MILPEIIDGFFKKGHVKVALGLDLYPVGELDYEEYVWEEVSIFRYSKNWLERPDAFALAPSLPLSEYPVRLYANDDSNAHQILPWVISDAIPDYHGKNIIQHAINSSYVSAFEYLLSVNDYTRQGALRFLDEEGQLLALPDSSPPEINEITGLMQLHNFSTGEKLHDVATRIIENGSSLGGQRPKCDFNDNGVLSIAKFHWTRNDILPIEQMEVATLRLASCVGLRAAKAHLILKDTKNPITILKRFDRKGKRRIHYTSAKSFLNGGDREGHGYYTDIADMMRQHCGGANTLPTELKELHNRIMFTILVSNKDDHLKNHGFLYAGNNEWVLSPAFDINPEPYGSGQLSTGISPYSGYQSSIEAAIEAAPFFNVSEDEARKSAVEMAERISNKWQKYCIDEGMTSSNIHKYTPAFEHSEMKLALGKLKSRMNISQCRHIAGLEESNKLDYERKNTANRILENFDPVQLVKNKQVTIHYSDWKWNKISDEWLLPVSIISSFEHEPSIFRKLKLTFRHNSAEIKTATFMEQDIMDKISTPDISDNPTP